MNDVSTLQYEFYEKIQNIKLDTEICKETGQRKHDYYLDNERTDSSYVGVTTYINKTLFKPFDKELAVAKVLNSLRYSKDERYRYYKQTKEQIWKQWEDSGEEGTIVHDQIDNFLKGGKKPPKEISVCLAIVLSRLVPNCYVFASEIAIVDKTIRMTGCIDALFFNPESGKYILLDWKANSVKKDHYGEFGIHPTSQRLPATKYHHYYCQMNMYSIILKRIYQIECEKLFVVGFGLDKQKEQPWLKTISEENRWDQLIKNMDVLEIPNDEKFQSDLVVNRLNEIKKS